jgi:24-hydroxycholesterol 7alpha-hydroxylase
LLSLFKLMVEGIRDKQAAGKGQDTLVEQLMKSVDEPSAHNYALLLLWASQANAVPVSMGYGGKKS